MLAKEHPPMRTRLEKDTRRQQLIEAATRVFAARGYAAVDVAAIVAEAGVARGTFYLYFQAKRDMLIAITEHYLALIEAQAALPPPPAATLQQQLAHSFAALLRHQAANRDLALVVLRDGWGADAGVTENLRAIGDAAKERLAATYQRLMDAGRLRPADSLITATAVAGMLREVTLHQVLLRQRTDIDAIADELAALIAPGLSARPAGS
jgi:AcrR family transcriptional regulator